MGFDPNEPEQRRRLHEAIKDAGIPVSELWLRYFGISGDAGEYEVEAYLQGLMSLPPLQRDLLAMAANELIDDLPRPRAPYADDLEEAQATPDADRLEEAQATPDPDRLEEAQATPDPDDADKSDGRN